MILSSLVGLSVPNCELSGGKSRYRGEVSQAKNWRSGSIGLQPSWAGGFPFRLAGPRTKSEPIRYDYQGCAPAAQALLQQLRRGYCQEPSRSGTTQSAFPDWAVSCATGSHRFFPGVERAVPLAVGFPLGLWDAAGAVVPVHCRQVVGLVLVDVKSHRLFCLSILTLFLSLRYPVTYTSPLKKWIESPASSPSLRRCLS